MRSPWICHFKGIVLALCALMAGPAFAGEVRGRVTDRADGSPLAGVNLRLAGTRLGAVSDSAGAYRLQASMIGYRTATVEDLALRSDTALRQDVALRADAIPLNEMVVTPGRFSVIQSDPVTSQTLSREEVRAMPQFGEDIFRAIVRLPGVSGSDFSARFNVRGGDYDQILVTLDGLELDEPFHLKDIAGGSVSIVDVEVIGGIDMMTGGFPAAYGDRQSAALEMTSRRPHPGHRTSAGLGLMHARRGYIDLVLKMIGEEENLSPDFYDLFGKLTFGKRPEDRFSLEVLGSSDRLRFKEKDASDTFNSRYGNGYAWFTWDATRGSRLHARTLSYAGRITRRRDGATFQVPASVIEEIVDDHRCTDVYGVKSDWTAQAGPSHLLNFGFEARALRADYAYFKRDRNVVQVSQNTRQVRYDTTRADLEVSGGRVSLYAGDRWRIAGPLTADAGLRYDRHSYGRGAGEPARGAGARPGLRDRGPGGVGPVLSGAGYRGPRCAGGGDRVSPGGDGHALRGRGGTAHWAGAGGARRGVL
ncbi:MAG: hypothetical protein EXS64_14135 [Candidatus Latescibacteria bacterium]|nr:hypothetical protein [Candidatus Latescibacterota bacterium]